MGRPVLEPRPDARRRRHARAGGGRAAAGVARDQHRHLHRDRSRAPPGPGRAGALHHHVAHPVARGPHARRHAHAGAGDGGRPRPPGLLPDPAQARAVQTGPGRRRPGRGACHLERSGRRGRGLGSHLPPALHGERRPDRGPGRRGLLVGCRPARRRPGPLRRQHLHPRDRHRGRPQAPGRRSLPRHAGGRHDPGHHPHGRPGGVGVVRALGRSGDGFRTAPAARWCRDSATCTTT